MEKPDTYNAGGSVMQLNRDLLAVAEDLARVTEEWESATVSTAESLALLSHAVACHAVAWAYVEALRRDRDTL